MILKKDANYKAKHVNHEKQQNQKTELIPYFKSF